MQIAVKFLNDNGGPDGLPPVFNTISYWSLGRCLAHLILDPLGLAGSGRADVFKNNSERMLAARTARAEYLRVVNAERLRRISKERISPANDRMHCIGEKVFVWREKYHDAHSGKVIRMCGTKGDRSSLKVLPTWKLNNQLRGDGSIFSFSQIRLVPDVTSGEEDIGDGPRYLPLRYPAGTHTLPISDSGRLPLSTGNAIGVHVDLLLGITFFSQRSSTLPMLDRPQCPEMIAAKKKEMLNLIMRL